MATLRPHTKTYSADARKRLGLAVTRAREAAGYPYRPAFAEAAGVSVRSIVKLEQGDPVGAAVYEAAARVLPTWDAETPRQVLEGSEAPTPEPQPATAAEAGDLEAEELALFRMLTRRGWSIERIDEALDEWRRERGVEQREESGRTRSDISVLRQRETGTK